MEKSEISNFGMTKDEIERLNSIHKVWGKIYAYILPFFMFLLLTSLYARSLIDAILILFISFFLTLPLMFFLTFIGLGRILDYPDKLFVIFYPSYRKIIDYEEEKKKYDAWIYNERMKLQREIEQEENRKQRQKEEFWKSLSGRQFERELSELFRAQGYNVFITPQTGDEGIDIILSKEGEKIIVQCKAHKTKIGVAVARELYGSLIHSKADKAILASLTGFSSGVKEYIKNKPITLLGLNEIIKMQE